MRLSRAREVGHADGYCVRKRPVMSATMEKTKRKDEDEVGGVKRRAESRGGICTSGCITLVSSLLVLLLIFFCGTSRKMYQVIEEIFQLSSKEEQYIMSGIHGF